MEPVVSAYFKALHSLLDAVEIRDGAGRAIDCGSFVAQIAREMHETHDRGGKIIFVGNGGSAAIASHMATDYLKNGKLRATALNDSALLTCLSNDLGYENVFSTQIGMLARGDDIVVAISSSGRSANILNAVNAARACGCRVVTLSGFAADNPLRTLGDYNVYIESSEYGFVEIGHLTIIHAIIDIDLGWGRDLGQTAVLHPAGLTQPRPS